MASTTSKSGPQHRLKGFTPNPGDAEEKLDEEGASEEAGQGQSRSPVIIGKRAFRTTWVITTVCSRRPFARAVRT